MFSRLYLAAEDEPGLAVGRKLVADAPPLGICHEENARGFGRLKNKVSNYERMGRNGLPVLMITDLDQYGCPSEKLNDWLGKTPTSGFLFRICVREVEAWLLAHREAMAEFLGVAASRIPIEPEILPDPKAKLIEISQRSPRRQIRTGFKPIGSATIGPDYNRLLSDFIRDSWSAGIAENASPSLRRARLRINQLANLVTP